MADEINHDDVTKIIEIANKSASGELKLPESDRQKLMVALAKLKGAFQTPVEATIELASGVKMISFTTSISKQCRSYVTISTSHTHLMM